MPERHGCLERVRDYPRPPRLKPAGRRVRIVLGGETIADTGEALRVLETCHPPTYYLPEAAFRPGVLVPGARGGWREWKGRARHWTVTAGGGTAPDAAWGHPDPAPACAALRGRVAVHAGPMDARLAGDERARPRPGGFHGGWVTPGLVGPFKGGPGTEGW